MKRILETAARYLLHPHFLICFLLGWMVTNGWAYLGLLVGRVLSLNGLTSISAAYLAFLWLPFTPEKILTFSLALLFLKRLFPEDHKVREILEELKKKQVSRE